MLLKRSTKPSPEPVASTRAPDSSPDEIRELLDDRQAPVRLEAIRRLVICQREQAGPLLCHRLIVETDGAIREAIAIELARLGGETVVGDLLPLLGSDDAALRNIVIDILKELPHDVAPRMETLLDDPDPDVRIFLVNVLEALRHPSVEDWLIAVISMDSNVNVVITALDLLNEVGTAAALPALRQTAHRFADEPFVVFSVESAFRRIGGDA